MDDRALTQSGEGQFPDTQWSLVLRAGREENPRTREALNTLCERYWYPIYAFIRRKGNDPEQALDLTQQYFFQLLNKGALARVDPTRGRFRSFLRKDCDNFLRDDHRRKTARMRHPGTSILSIDAATAEGRYLVEPAHDETAEVIFERNWARTLLERVLDSLRQKYGKSGESLRFEHLRMVLLEPGHEVPYAEIARRLDTTEQAVATAVHRLRRRYREALREEIAATVADPSEIDDEIRELFRALRH
ncbi:MAG: sigma-70 family RNA polymerase sigma factor [Isosphaeraceae bacterium]